MVSVCKKDPEAFFAYAENKGTFFTEGAQIMGASDCWKLPVFAGGFLLGNQKSFALKLCLNQIQQFLGRSSNRMVMAVIGQYF